MKVLIADKLHDSLKKLLDQAGCRVMERPKSGGEDLRDAIASLKPDVLIVRSTRVTGEMLAGSRLALIVRAGAGVNTIDLEGASQRGIFVANCPGQNAAAVAELAFGLILAVDRRIADGVADLRKGSWNKAAYAKGHGLKGRVLGIVGLGAIGREMIPRARSFGMGVVGWSRSLTDASAAALGIERLETKEAVAAASDVVSVHLAITDETRSTIGSVFFQRMRPGSIFINTSRAEVVDSEALLAALDERELRAGLDLFDNEPATKVGAIDDPLARHPRVYGTHHIGASTAEAQEAVAVAAARIIIGFKQTGRVANCVNLLRFSPATHLLTVRHRDRPGVLADVLDRLKQRSINVQEMDNIIFRGAEAAVARIQLDGPLPQADIDELESGNGDILAVSLTPLATADRFTQGGS